MPPRSLPSTCMTSLSKNVWSSFNIWPELISRLTPSCRFSSPHVVLRPIDRMTVWEDTPQISTFTSVVAMPTPLTVSLLTSSITQFSGGFSFRMPVENEYEGLFWKTFYTLGFEFFKYCSFKTCQPLAPCSFSVHKIARYVSQSFMLCLMCSLDIPTQAQGVISICWGCDDKKRNRKRCQMGYRTKTYTPKPYLEQLLYLIRCHPMIPFLSVSFWI